MHFVFGIVQHGLATSHGGGIFTTDVQLVSHRGKFLQDVRFYSRLNSYVTATFGAYREACIFQRGLNIHAVVHHVGDELRMGQRLVRAAHDSESDVLLAAFHERGNDSVKRTLAWSQSIRARRIEREQSASVLQCKPHAADGNARAEAFVVTLDERNDVAVAIDHREIGGVTHRRRA